MTTGKPCHSVHPPTAHTTANQRVPRNLLQELLLLLLVIGVPLLLTVALWQQQISVDPVEAGGGDGAEALPPEQPPPVELVHIL